MTVVTRGAQNVKQRWTPEGCLPYGQDIPMKPSTFEVYMLVKDRKRLARLIEIQEVSRREVARAAGWKSHTYLLRLLSGEATTLEPEHAVKIATFLQVDLYDLFMPRVSSAPAHNAQRRTTRRRAA